MINFPALINLHIRRVGKFYSNISDRLLFTSCSHVYFHYRVIDSIFIPSPHVHKYFYIIMERLNELIAKHGKYHDAFNTMKNIII